MPIWVNPLIGVIAALGVAWLALVVALAITRPAGGTVREASKLLPNLLRLITRLARDPALPRRSRWRLRILLVYLASPIDIIPDFVPVIGYVDDILITALVLRSTVRTAGLPALRAHWPGSEDGFAIFIKLTGLPQK